MNYDRTSSTVTQPAVDRRKPDASRSQGIEPPPRALAIWRARPDLQAAFDVQQPHGRQSLARWYFLEAYREMGLSPDPAYNEAAQANLPCRDLPRFFDIPITWLMRELWAREHARRSSTGIRRHLRWLAYPAVRLARRRYSLKTRRGQGKCLEWYFTKGLTDACLVAFLTPEQARFLKAPESGCAGSSRILNWIWKQDSEPRDRFSSPDDQAFHAWAAKDGARKWPVLRHPAIGIARVRPVNPALSYPIGVNVIGHARGRSGIGEDVRMAARALRSAGIPHVIYELGTARNLPPEDSSVSHLISDELPYAINLFCVTAMDTVASITGTEHDFRDGRYTIGFWPWELAEWPMLWKHAYDFVDEVWASSRFAFDAHVNSASKPLRHMPMAISTEETMGWTRSTIGVAEDVFIFSFAFDGLSSFPRKNPDACLAAFRTAFPLGTEPVALILKGMRVEGHAGWQSLRLAAQADPRVKLIGGSVPRGALLDLHRMTDCFLSLHRSEGFGRNIAECMGLGKPVIATAYSGNLDFTTRETAALVPGPLRELVIGEYPFGEGQQWADPDVGTAAELMARMVEDSGWRASLAANGKELVDSRYQPEVVGAAYARALHEIWQTKNKVRSA